MKSPTPSQIRKARHRAGHTQTQAGEAVHVSLRAWQEWEGGRAKMSPGLWELYRIKTG